jgi:hypothetical protein
MLLHANKLPSAALLCAILCSANTSHAHFKLLSPAAWLNEDSSGGPQKGSPCGPGGSDDVSPAPTSGKVTEFHAGEEIEVKWVDTIAHPGHFRIALAENRTDLKDPDITQDSFCSYDEMMVPKEAKGNVLADGVSFRSRTGFSAQAGTMFSAKVTLPNKPCDKCTLQVMQIMENDLQSISNCYYFHCADIKILPAAGGAAGNGAAGSAAGGAGSAAGASAGAGGVASGAVAGSSAAGSSSSAAGSSSSAAGSRAAGSSAAGSSAAGTPVSMMAGSPATPSGGAPAASAGNTGTMMNASTAAPADSSGCSLVRVGTLRHGNALLAAVFVCLLGTRRYRRSRASRLARAAER